MRDRRHTARGCRAACWPILLACVGAPAHLGAAAAPDGGSNSAGLWSVQPIDRPALPAVRDDARISNAIDRFVAARLHDAGMTMAPPADERSLVRRVYFDLVGLPPTYQQTEAYLNDCSTTKYDRLIDRLIDSPQHGERWARFWLDVVRFAETNGYERDAAKPGAWKYRDYVVHSFNADKPYDRFVVEQLAGDEIPDRSEETVIATGLMRLGTWDDEPNVPEAYTFERIEDLVHTVCSTFLALTVKCARCHDHRFDPIPQTEYYELASAFWAGFVQPRESGLQGGPSADELGYDVLGWTDRGRDVPPLHLLEAGDPARPLEAVSPAALSLVAAVPRQFAPPPAAARTTQRRLQLAQWIVAKGNPLPARVMVNRVWQHHFGEGIVSAPNNFGTKGQPPSHPQLLDWLASEFVRGGWSIKRLHRVIMMSAAYRMASSHPSQQRCSAVDSQNRLLWRFPRRRLDAEALRDAMLAASGQLNLTMGGPGFFPALSPEAAEGLSRKGESWDTSPIDEQRRRSIYIFTKRSLLVPLMTTFDFCDTTTSCGKRDVTTVPPQALALLNNHFVHAQSMAMAGRLVRDAGHDVTRQIERAWEVAFARRPGVVELEAARDHVQQQRRYYGRWMAGRSGENLRSDIGPALSGMVAGAPADADAEQLALASLCHVLINANEFVFID